MSAICGKFNRSGETVSAENLDSVMLEMAGYGRDGADTWHDGPVVLGQQVTYITPESRLERLPYQDVQGGLVIAADARLDNREELFDVLGIDRVDRKVIGDSQLILQAYRHWAEDCPAHLLGDFAFAIWNAEKREMFCARDFMGVRPFYYHISRTGFNFASDIAALLKFTAVPRELDLRYVRAQLEIFGFYHKEFSFYQDVFKLPPAHSLLVRKDRLQKSCYWQPGQAASIRYQKDEIYFEKLLELMQEAVACRIRSDFPVGSHISGGLDSSAITTLAARAMSNEGRQLHGFSWAPPPAVRDYPLSDERAVVEKVCSREGVDLHFTPFDVSDLIEDWTRDITTQPSEMLTWELPSSRIAKQSGVRMLLSGWGGDEFAAFNGRGYFADLFRRGRWIRMTKELRLRADLHNANPWEGFRNKVILPLTPDSMLAKLRPHSQHLTQRQSFTGSLQPGFAAELRQCAPHYEEALRERPGVRRNQIDLLNFGHLTQRMESWAASGGRQGIAYSYPLLDRKIVEFCLNIPAYLYFKNGWKRYMFREAATHILPIEAQWKKMKDDPALTRQIIALMSKADRQLLELLRGRRDSIQSRGYVEVSDLMASLSKLDRSGEGIGDYSEDVRQRMWLAFI